MRMTYNEVISKYFPRQKREEFEKRVSEFPSLKGKYDAIKVGLRYKDKKKKEKKIEVCQDCGLPPNLCICEELQKEEDKKCIRIWR